jgi:hypothetical protein
MRALLFADNTLPLPVASICDLVNRTCDTVQLSPGRSLVRIGASAIAAGEIPDLLGNAVQAEASGYDYAFICTAVPYDNNYFFDSNRKLIVLSFSEWNLRVFPGVDSL